MATQGSLDSCGLASSPASKRAALLSRNDKDNRYGVVFVVSSDANGSTAKPWAVVKDRKIFEIPEPAKTGEVWANASDGGFVKVPDDYASWQEIKRGDVISSEDTDAIEDAVTTVVCPVVDPKDPGAKTRPQGRYVKVKMHNVDVDLVVRLFRIPKDPK